MDEIHPEVHRNALDYSSVACCHTLSPNVKVFYTLKNPLGTLVAFFQSANNENIYFKIFKLTIKFLRE